MPADTSRLAIASRLYSAHAAMSRLFGDRFPALVAPYIEALTRIAEEKKLNTLEALMFTLGRLQEMGDEGAKQAMYCAAAVEMSEAPE